MRYVKKSLAIIKKLQLKNGGILATFENDAYPFIYSRDAALMTLALNLKKEYKKSVKFYQFLKQVQRNGEMLQRYNKEGLPFVTRKGQKDCTGLTLHGIYHTYCSGASKDFLSEMWPFVARAVAFLNNSIERGLIRSDTSIHEFYRLENGYEIWANCACCRGIYSASKIAKELGKDYNSRKWKAMADNLKKTIKRELFDRERGVFIKTLRPDGYKIMSADVSILSPFYFDIIGSKEILDKTMKFLKRQIWDKSLGGFKRFRKFEICKDWHWYTGGDGPWSIFTIWGAHFYKELKQEKNSKECERWVERIITKKGFLPEHIARSEEYQAWKTNEIEFSERLEKGFKRSESLKSPKTKIYYWATPHGWSQAEYIFLKLKQHSNLFK